MKRHNFKKLNIWKEGLNIVSETYKMTKTFPKQELYGLANQMNRCAVSIPSNIAEGTSKSTDKHLNKYIEDALGSAYEWETQLIVAYNEKYIDIDAFDKYEKQILALQKMISGFQNGLDL